VAQHLLQLVHFQDGLSLLEAELCEESLQTAQCSSGILPRRAGAHLGRWGQRLSSTWRRLD
jgi:hypothetical protein